MTTPKTKKGHETTTRVTKMELTPDAQKLLASYPLHTAAEIHSYLHPAEGLDRVLPQMVTLLHSHPAIGTALKIDPATLTKELAEADALDGPTQIAYALYRRGFENAMEKRSDITRAVYKVNRFVQNAEDPELARAFAAVSEWVASTHAHNTKAHDADDAGGPNASGATPKTGPTT